ncbi:MAG: GNAT family N-acetyltransferase [Pseudomonadota bacterium]
MSLFTIVIFTLVATGLGRLFTGDWRTARLLGLGAFGGLILLALIGPGRATFFATIGSSLSSLSWLAIAALPIGVYALFVRNLRRRAEGLEEDRAAEAPRPRGFVLIEEDDDLHEEMVARLRAENRRATNWNRRTFSIAHRGPDNEIIAAGRGILNMGLVEIRGVWIDPGWRGRGMGRGLLSALEEEARSRGADRAAVDTYSWQAREFYLKAGYDEYAVLPYPNGTSRHYLQKELSA